MTRNNRQRNSALEQPRQRAVSAINRAFLARGGTAVFAHLPEIREVMEKLYLSRKRSLGSAGRFGGTSIW